MIILEVAAYAALSFVAVFMIVAAVVLPRHYRDTDHKQGFVARVKDAFRLSLHEGQD